MSQLANLVGNLNLLLKASIRFVENTSVFFLMALLDAILIVGTRYVRHQGTKYAESVPISLDFIKEHKLLFCQDSNVVQSCTQFIKAGWSYGATWIALSIVTLMSIFVSLYYIRIMCKKLLTRIGVFLVMSFFIAFMIVDSETPDRMYSVIGNAAIGSPQRYGVFDLVFFATGMTEILDYSIRLASALSEVAGVFTGAACAATVLDLPGKIGLDGKIPLILINIRMSEMSIRFYRLRVLITIGAVFLVLGVFSTAGYLAWPISFVKDTDRNNFRNLTDGILLILGTQYSLLLLLGFFLPAGRIFLHARSLAIRSGASSQKEIDALLDKFGLNFSFPSVLKDTLAVISPFVASALVSAIKLVP